MITAMLLALTTLAASHSAQPDARTHAQAAADAWNRGALAEAGAQASQAYAALAQSECFVTPDSTRLAFMAGVAAAARQTNEYAGYYFWAAGQLNAAAGGLNRSERRVAEALGAEPGVRPSEDWRYARSPLLSEPNPRRSRGCQSFLPALDRSPPVQDAALVIARAPFPDGRFPRPQTLYSYPDRAGRALVRQIAGTYHRFQESSTPVLHVFVFAPCHIAYDEQRDPMEICLDAAPAP